MAPFIVCIDGLIGAGKSTLIQRLSQYAPSFAEPVQDWTLLPFLYTDLIRYGPPFQFQVLLSQFNQRQTFPDGLVFVERCPWTSRHVFAPLFLDDACLSVYHSFYQTLAYEVDHFIYLDIDPTAAYTRIRDRSPLDSQISLEYLVRLHQSYRDNLLTQRSDVSVISALYPEDELERMIVNWIHHNCFSFAN